MIAKQASFYILTQSQKGQRQAYIKSWGLTTLQQGNPKNVLWTEEVQIRSFILSYGTKTIGNLLILLIVDYFLGFASKLRN